MSAIDVSRSARLGRIVRPRRQWRRLTIVLLAGLLGAIVVSAIAAPVIAPYDPNAQNIADQLVGPSGSHLMGTDSLGRDVLSRVLYGGRISVLVGVCSTGLAVAVGIVWGTLAAYAGGWWDEVAMRFIDLIIGFPGLVLAITVVAVLGSTVPIVIATIAIVQLPTFARLIRASVLRELSLEYVIATRSAGATWARLVTHHLIPNAVAPVRAIAPLLVADAVMLESALSFLGLGVEPPTPTWGNILSAGSEFVSSGAWWLTVFPGLAIFLTIFTLNALADTLSAAGSPYQ